MPRIVPVILCGGSGTRLWPRSRANKPKPFLNLLGERTLYQATLERCANTENFAPPVVVIGENHLAFAREQAAQIAPETRYIIEPQGRNTAPAVALAALSLEPTDIMLVCPSDHHILNEQVFEDAVRSASQLADQDWLVAFGIEATAPATGYGYLLRGEELNNGYRIEKFVEKPDPVTALGFIEHGGYAWNGGIFSFKVSAFLEGLAKYRPQLTDLVQSAMENARIEDCLTYPNAEIFTAIEGESVDYALMENTDRAAMVDVAMGWSDIGSWDSIYSLRASDDAENIIVGTGEIIDATGSMIDSDKAFVTIVGADNIVVVVDGEDILVADRNTAQKVGMASRIKS